MVDVSFGRWIRGMRVVLAGLAAGCGLFPCGLAAEEGGVKLFGLPVAKEEAAKAEILSASFPSGLLALGIGSPAERLGEEFPDPGDREGDPAAPFHVAQNLVEKDGEKTSWPYFGHRMSVFCRRGSDGKLVIGEMSIGGLFDTTSDTPFRKGGRAEVRTMIRCFFAAYGKPVVHRVIEDKKEHLGQVDFDQLVWKRPEGTVFLIFGGARKSGKLPFHLDIRNPATTPDRVMSIRPPRWNEKPEPVKADFSKRFEAFCDFLEFDMKK